MALVPGRTLAILFAGIGKLLLGPVNFVHLEAFIFSRMSHFVGVNGLSSKKIQDAAAERALVEQCRRQDFEAFGRVIDAYQGRVHGFVKRMLRNEEDAADVTQEVFIKAFQAMESFDGRSSLRSWLFRIAYNLCVDKTRRAKRTVSAFSYEGSEEYDEPMEFADVRWNPESQALNEELYEIVNKSIDSLSEKLKTVLLLHDKEDMGYDEIAQAMEIPVGTVKSRLFLARAHVQQSVGQYLTGGMA